MGDGPANAANEADTLATYCDGVSGTLRRRLVSVTGHERTGLSRPAPRSFLARELGHAASSTVARPGLSFPRRQLKRYPLIRAVALRTASAAAWRRSGSLAASHALAPNFRARSLRASSKAPSAPANSNSRPRLLFAARSSPLINHGTVQTVQAPPLHPSNDSTDRRRSAFSAPDHLAGYVRVPQRTRGLRAGVPTINLVLGWAARMDHSPNGP
jgi:hypothetical protein